MIMNPSAKKYQVTKVSGRDRFVNACISGNIDEAKMLYELGFYCYNSKKLGCKNIFCDVCDKGHIDVAKWLYSIDNKILKQPRVSLGSACETGNIELIKWLWEINPKFLEQISEGGEYGLLSIICSKGYLTIAQWVHNIGAEFSDIDRIFNKTCKAGHYEMAKWLYKLDKSTEQVDTYCHSDKYRYSYIKSAFNEACENGHFKIAKWLYKLNTLNKSRSTDIDGINYDNIEYAFIKACENGHFEIAKWLYDLDNSVIKRKNPLRYVIEHGQLEMIKWLYQIYNISKPFKIDTLEYIIKITFKKGKLDIGKWLIDSVYAHYTHDHNDDTVINVDYDYGEKETFWRLTRKEHEEKYKKKNKKHYPFYYVCYSGNLEMVDFYFNKLKTKHDEKKEINNKVDTLINDEDENENDKEINEGFIVAHNFGHYHILKYLCDHDRRLIAKYLYYFDRMELKHVHNLSNQTVDMLVSIKNSMLLPNIDNVNKIEDVVIHALKIYNRIDDLKKINTLIKSSISENRPVPFEQYDISSRSTTPVHDVTIRILQTENDDSICRLIDSYLSTANNEGVVIRSGQDIDHIKIYTGEVYLTIPPQSGYEIFYKDGTTDFSTHTDPNKYFKKKYPDVRIEYVKHK